MNLKQFDKIVTDQLSRSELVLMGKGTEYAEEATDETEVDRLAHFKKAAALQDMTTAQAAFGMLSKHLVPLPIWSALVSPIRSRSGMRRSPTVSTIC